MRWPGRAGSTSPSQRLDLAALGKLTFEAPDRERFPCLALAEACLRSGGLTPTILNAANEIAVDAFLDRRIAFYDIPRVVEATLAADGSNRAVAEDLETVLAVDKRARETAVALCRKVAA